MKKPKPITTAAHVINTGQRSPVLVWADRLHCPSLFSRLPASDFFFFILKKLKFQKYMSILKNFKNIPRSPYGGDMAQMYFFFFKFATKSLEKKKEGGLSPPQRATGPCRPPQGRQDPVPARGAGRPSCGRQGGPVAPPRATGSGRLYKASPSFPPLI